MFNFSTCFLSLEMHNLQIMTPKDGLRQMEVLCVCVHTYSAYSVSKVGVNRLTEIQAKISSEDPTKDGTLVNAVRLHEVPCMYQKNLYIV